MDCPLMGRGYHRGVQGESGRGYLRDIGAECPAKKRVNLNEGEKKGVEDRIKYGVKHREAPQRAPRGTDEYYSWHRNPGYGFRRLGS